MIEGRVCVIGAGSSGLPVVKALAEREIEFDCFERSDRVGGNWAFRNPNGMSSAYRSLRANTSRTRMQYADFPMPADCPDFPHHSDIARYFASYAEQFGLGERIAFGRTVERAWRENGGWTVEMDGGERRRYTAMVVASGHHWDPRWPEPPVPGRFDGETFHAHHYVDAHEPVEMAGKQVVVVGLGNSAVDIAVELSRPGTASRVFLSARRGAWILPRELFGLPIDTLRVTRPWLPWRAQSAIVETMLRLVSPGVPWKAGLPRPDHPPLAAHPTISQDLIGCVRRGEIVAKPAIAGFEGSRVRFADGSTEKADIVVFCTGYKVSFPFFGPETAAAPGNDLPLWRRMLRPGEADLFFVGLLQPLGAIMPLAEAQAKLIAAFFSGEYAFPDAATMAEEAERERRAHARRYVPSPRHTMEVDFDLYLRELRRELARGRRRAVAAHSLANGAMDGPGVRARG